MKKSILLPLIMLILLMVNNTKDLETSGMKVLQDIKKTKLEINPIIPKNDAYHGSKNYPSNEWWYFDAVFDKNYSVHVGLKILSFGKLGFLQQIVNIYNNTKVEEKVVITKPLRHFQISTELPDIKYKNKPLLKFDTDGYNKTGKWNYTITIDVEHIKINLIFMGKSDGFTYVTAHEGWTVAQPKADVFGTIQIKEKKLLVTGRGYHDHNWNFSLGTSTRATGWYWGKIMSPNYSLTWAKIKKTRFADDTLAENFGILNTVDDGYLGIDPSNISFIASDYKFQTARFIPTKFSLYAKQGNIEINITFTAVEIQHTEPDFLTINYWRYFISINGYLRIGEKIDYLKDDIQIMEHLRFI